MKRLAMTALAAASLGLGATSAQAITLLGLTGQNQLATIDTGNIAGATRIGITGLDAGDSFVGIDTRPSNGLVYGITQSNRVYTLNPLTGAASFVTVLSAPAVQAALGYGIDFNPVADASGAASLRLVSSAGSNFAVNVATGAVGNAASNIGIGYTGVGYTNASPLGPPPASTALYYINSDNNSLYQAPAAFNNPTIGLVGALGVDVVSASGFEVLPDNTAYAAFGVYDSASLVTGLYSVSLGTGAATLLGTFDGSLTGLTSASPVPEPQSLALMLAGLASLGFMARRRRQPRHPG